MYSVAVAVALSHAFKSKVRVIRDVDALVKRVDQDPQKMSLVGDPRIQWDKLLVDNPACVVLNHKNIFADEESDSEKPIVS